MNVSWQFEYYFDECLRQVFLYLTDSCNLHCKQCLYKIFLKRSMEIDVGIAIRMLKKFYYFGARKLTLIGGEPTLYDKSNGNRNLFRLIEVAKNLGYEYIRMDTNGQFHSTFFNNKSVFLLDEISFSLDGYSSSINDAVRGDGAFRRCLQNIERSICVGLKTHITSCVHSLCVKSGNGIGYLNSFVDFASNIGVSTVNFHPVIKVGISRDAWIDSVDISPRIWLNMYRDFAPFVDVFGGVHVRMPQRFIEREVYEQNKNKYQYCPVKLRERLLVFPDGDIKVCSFQIGQSKRVAYYTDSCIQWERACDNNEILSCEVKGAGGCCIQNVGDSELVPLCMSFKPGQSEFVWNSLVDNEIVCA